MTEKCSEIACTRKPIIEIVAWDGITLSEHRFLCRDHWYQLSEEIQHAIEPPKIKIKVLKFVKDLRSYL